MKRFTRLIRLVGSTTSISMIALGFMCGACGATDEPPVTRADFCAQWAAAACSPEVVSVCQASSAEACQDAQRENCLAVLPDSFQDQGVDACISAVGNAYSDADLTADELDVVVRFGAPCSSVLTASGGGERCTSDADCESELRCILKDEAEGTCEAPELVQAGFSCSEAAQTCEAGFFCNGDNCIAALGEDEACVNHRQCGVQMYCDSTCAPLVSIGEDCSEDAECVSGICYQGDDRRTCLDRIRLSPAEPLCDALK